MLVTKLGQPVPLSNFIFDVNSGRPQPAQANTPGRCSSSRGLENGRSVPSSRSTSYTAGDNERFHSSRDLLTTSVGSGAALPFGNSICQLRRISSIDAGVNALRVAGDAPAPHSTAPAA